MSDIPAMSRAPQRSVTSGRRRRVLDLFCKAGGAGYGYLLAGCDVLGVDIDPQPRYPGPFIRADAMTFPLDGFDLIHASPVCKRYSSATPNDARDSHPDQIPGLRDRLEASGIPYVIENVPGAPLRNPVLLCGSMFGLRVIRHRMFETSFPLTQPPHPVHPWKSAGTSKAGDRPGGTWLDGDGIQHPGQPYIVAGHLSDTDGARAAMGISWMSGAELAQAIPPAYTQWIATRDGSRQCESCGRWWSPRRADARTCSPACRKALSRSRVETATRVAVSRPGSANPGRPGSSNPGDPTRAGFSR